jgi:hypothetical protein
MTEETPSNSHKLGTFVAEAMEQVDDSDYELGEILLIVEMRNAERNTTSTRFVCSDPRAYVQFGLLRAAQMAAEDKA